MERSWGAGIFYAAPDIKEDEIMISRFLEKMRDPAERKVFFTIFAGKLLGVALLLAAVTGVSSYLGGKAPNAYADQTSAVASTLR